MITLEHFNTDQNTLLSLLLLLGRKSSGGSGGFCCNASEKNCIMYISQGFSKNLHFKFYMKILFLGEKYGPRLSSSLPESKAHCILSTFEVG